MVGWIRGILDNFRVGSPVERRGVTEEQGKAPLFDVTDGYFLVEEGRRLGASWIQRSREDFRDLRRRILIRLKVKKNLSSVYLLPEVVDEVTEKIYTDSRENSRLKRMFG